MFRFIVNQPKKILSNCESLNTATIEGKMVRRQPWASLSNYNDNKYFYLSTHDDTVVSQKPECQKYKSNDRKILLAYKHDTHVHKLSAVSR